MKPQTLKQWNLIASCIFLTGAILFGASVYRNGALAPPSALGLLLCIGSIILGLVKLRCPFCHHFLGLLSGGSYPFCPWCGGQLSSRDSDQN